MKSQIAIVLATVLAAAGSSAIAHEHEHAAATPATTGSAARTQRFAADATLRKEMQGIRTSVAALEHYGHGHMGPEQAVILATAIEGHVRTIIANCKLPPEADAALHRIIVPLLQDAAALKKAPRDLAPIPRLRRSVDEYDRQFRNP